MFARSRRSSTREYVKLRYRGGLATVAVVDGHVVTSMGPGTSLAFALKLVELLFDKDKADEIAKQMLTTCA